MQGYNQILTQRVSYLALSFHITIYRIMKKATINKIEEILNHHAGG